ncbi:Uncharacterised protein [uncultured archaeon]|nr:Uncharacterised protein [uncultured archaeon]
MKSFIEKYVKPLKYHYLIVGALITLFSILQSAFPDFVGQSILLGIVLFGILVTFTYIFLEMQRISNKNKGSVDVLLVTLYEFFYIMFVLVFFLAVYQKFGKVFSFCLGLTIGLVIIRIFALIRRYFVMLEKIVHNIWAKRGIRFGCTLVILIFGLIVILYTNSQSELLSLPLEIDAVTLMQWFYLPLSGVILIGLMGVLLQGVLDIFKKNPEGIEKAIWKKSKLFLLIKKLKRKKLPLVIKK